MLQWENQTQLGNIYLRLGGMHLLMSYCVCIGTLIAASGIEEILSVTFGGVLKLLNGSKYPQHVRAFRMLVEELLRPVFAKHHWECVTDLLQALDDTAPQSRTTKLWVDCVIKPVFASRHFEECGPFVLCHRTCPLCQLCTLLPTICGRVA